MKKELSYQTPQRKGYEPYKSTKVKAQIQSINRVYKEVVVETKDQEVPLITILKVNTEELKKKNQCVYRIHNFMGMWEERRKIFCFKKLANYTKNMKIKCGYAGLLIKKIAVRKKEETFQRLVLMKLLPNKSLVGSKIIKNISNKIYFKNITTAYQKLHRNRLNSFIEEFSNENKLVKQVERIHKENDFIKETSFEKQLVSRLKILSKMSRSDLFIENIEKHNLKQMIKVQMSRFEKIRSKSNPKKRQMLQNQIFLSLFQNTLISFETLVNDHVKMEQKLEIELQSYTNQTGMKELEYVIAQKQNQIIEFEKSINQISRMDVEFKRWINDLKNNQSKIISLVQNQIKKIDQKPQKDGSKTIKLYFNRKFLLEFILKVFSYFISQVETENKTFNEICQHFQNLKELQKLNRNIRKNTPQKTIIQSFISLNVELDKVYGELQDAQEGSTEFTNRYEELLQKFKKVQEELEQNKQKSQDFNVTQEKILEASQQQDKKLEIQNQDLRKNIKKLKQENLKQKQQIINLKQKFSQTDEIQSNQNYQRLQQQNQRQKRQIIQIKKNQRNLKQQRQKDIEKINSLQKNQNIFNNRRQEQTQIQIEVNNMKIQQQNIKILHNEQISKYMLHLKQYESKIRQLEMICSKNQMKSIKRQNYERQSSQKITQKQANILKLYKKVSELEAKVSIKDKEINYYEDKFRLQESEISKMKSSSQHLENSLKILKKTNDDLLMKYKDQMKDNENCKIQILTLKTSVPMLESSAKQLKSQKQTLKEINKTLKQQLTLIKRTTQQNDYQSKNSNKKLTSEVKKIKEQYLQREKNLQEKISSQNMKIVQLQYQLVNSKNSIHQHQQQIEKDYSDSSSNVNRDQQITYLLQKIETLEKFNNDLRIQYEALQRKFYLQKMCNSESKVHKNGYDLLEETLQWKRKYHQVLRFNEELTSQNTKLKQDKYAKSSGASEVNTEGTMKFYMASQTKTQHRYEEENVEFQREKELLKIQIKQKEKLWSSRISQIESNLQQNYMNHLQFKNNYEKQRLEWQNKQKNYKFKIDEFEIKLSTMNKLQQKKSYDSSKEAYGLTIQKLSQQTQLSQEIQQLIKNNEVMYNNIEELQTENSFLKDKLESYPQPQYIVELLFNILINVANFSSKSEDGKALWQDLMEIKNQNKTENFFVQLEDYCIEFLSSYLEKSQPHFGLSH